VFANYYTRHSSGLKKADNLDCFAAEPSELSGQIPREAGILVRLKR
jgi:hypothetical protein